MTHILQILEYPIKHHWADAFGILGFPLALLGIILTLNDARKAKSAADTARLEVQKLRQSLRQVDTMQNLANAVTIIEEIKRIHRYNRWDNGLLERYSNLKRTLVRIKSENSDLQPDQKAILQNGIQRMTDFEAQVEGAIAPGSGANSIPKVARLNKLLSEDIQKLDELLIELRSKVGD